MKPGRLFFIAVAFLLLTDPARARDSFHFAVIGDRTGEFDQKAFEQVVTDVARLHPDLVVTVGDLVEDWRDEIEWDLALGPMKRFTCPVYYTPGNHDIKDDDSAMVFKQKTGCSPYYSFDFKNTHLVVINNAIAESYAEIDSEQKAWLEGDLIKNMGKANILVFMHKPFWAHAVAKGASDRMHDLFKRTGVDAVFTGHWHQYAYQKIDGIEYIVAGSSGGTLVGRRNMDIGNDYQFLWCHVDGEKLSVGIIQSGSTFPKDMLSASEAKLSREIAGKWIQASGSFKSNRAGQLTVSITNKSGRDLNETLELHTEGNWKFPKDQITFSVGDGKTFETRVPFRRTGSTFPLPVLRVPYPFPGGKRVVYEVPADIARRIRIRTTTNRPEIDGVITEKEWRNAVVVKEWGDAYGNPSSADETVVYLLGDRKNLYVAAVCVESDMERLRSHYKKRDQDVYYDDRFGMMLAPDEDTLYFFYINPDGVIWDLIVRRKEGRSDKSFDANLAVKTSRQKDRWIAEMMIPLDELSEGKLPRKWRINIRRKQQRKPAEALFMPSWTNAPRRFGIIELPPAVRRR